MPEGKAYALLIAGVIHTLVPFRAFDGPAREFKWRACRDGVVWRLFKTKGEWERAAKMSARPNPLPDGPQIRAAYRAEVWGAHEAAQLYDALFPNARGDVP